MAIDIFCHQHSMFVKLIALVYPWYLFPLSLSLSWTTTYVTKFCLTNTFWHVWLDGVIIHIFQVVVSCWHIKCNHCAKNNIFITIWGTTYNLMSPGDVNNANYFRNYQAENSSFLYKYTKSQKNKKCFEFAVSKLI